MENTKSVTILYKMRGERCEISPFPLDKPKIIWYNLDISQKTIQNYLKTERTKEKWLLSIIATRRPRRRLQF